MVDPDLGIRLLIKMDLSIFAMDRLERGKPNGLGYVLEKSNVNKIMEITELYLTFY